MAQTTSPSDQKSEWSGPVIVAMRNHRPSQCIVVIGGLMQRVGCTNSVIVWDPSTKRWRNGPSRNLSDGCCWGLVVSLMRANLVALVCRDKAYAIGGFGDNNDDYTTLDTIESIISSVWTGLALQTFPHWKQWRHQ